MDAAVHLEDALRLMFYRRDGEMLREDGKRIDEQLPLAIQHAFLHLFLRTIGLTEETGALGQRLLIHLRTRRYDAGWIPLYLDAGCADGQFAGLNTPQVLITLAGSIPLLQLTVEEALQG